MNKSTLILLFSVAAAVIMLVIFSVFSSNSKIRADLAARVEKNILHDILEKTAHRDSVINDDLLGKTVMINVWATWCRPCIKEIPELNQLAKDFASDDIRFIALDGREAAEELEVMEEREINFDFELHFSQEELIDLLYSYKLDHERAGIPLNIVINTEGKAVFFYIGNQPDKLKEIRAYLNTVSSS